MKSIDWYNKLKLDIIELVLNFQMLKQEVVFILCTNRWILDDINLCEDFINLKHMLSVSDNDLDELVKIIYKFDNESILFNKIDLLDEYDYVKENIDLEFSYINNMATYMAFVDDLAISDNELVTKFDEYYENDINYYNQIKINNENLKRLRKERRDYSE